MEGCYDTTSHQCDCAVADAAACAALNVNPGPPGNVWTAGCRSCAPPPAATAVEITKILGQAFVDTIRDMPYFFEKNKLARPLADAEASYAPALTPLPTPPRTPDATAAPEAANELSGGAKAAIGVCAAVAALLLVFVAAMISKEKAGTPMFGEQVNPMIPKNYPVKQSELDGALQ